MLYNKMHNNNTPYIAIAYNEELNLAYLSHDCNFEVEFFRVIQTHTIQNLNQYLYILIAFVVVPYQIYTVNSRYNQVGYNEITAYNEMKIFPCALNALIIIRL